MPATTIDTAQLAKLLDVTPRTIQRLTIDGVIHRALDEDGSELRGRYTLMSIPSYCRYVRSMQRIDHTDQSRYEQLRNAKMASDAELSQLRLQQLKGQLHHARDVEIVWTGILTRVKARVMALPSRIARLCVGKKFREIYDIIMREIRLILLELSEYGPALFKQQREDYLESQGIDLGDLHGDNGESDEAESDETVEI